MNDRRFGERGLEDGRRGEGTLMDYIRASELGYCRRICSGALLYGSPFNVGLTAAGIPAGNEGNAIKY